LVLLLATIYAFNVAGTFTIALAIFVAEYMLRRNKTPSQSRRTFIDNYASDYCAS